MRRTNETLISHDLVRSNSGTGRDQYEDVESWFTPRSISAANEDEGAEENETDEDESAEESEDD
jgi:hypothetical protein